MMVLKMNSFHFLNQYIFIQIYYFFIYGYYNKISFSDLIFRVNVLYNGYFQIYIFF